MNGPGKIKFGEVISVNYKDVVLENSYNIRVKLYEYEKNESTSEEVTAIPLDNNIKHIPVKGEIVLLLMAPASYASSTEKIFEYFYLNPISLHNSTHHNSLPELTKYVSNKIPKNYSDVSAGTPNTSTKSTSLGSSFKEKADVNSIQAYEGDVIHEGRWGNSIRFSSTIIGGKYSKNPFWNGTKNGDPILTIRNGQGSRSGRSKFCTEDINEDKSSIYLTTSQLIDLKLASNRFNSYDSPPTPFSKFNKPQLMFNSDRIVLNAKKDSIFLSSIKSVGITTKGSFNVDASKKSVIDSPQIFLGSKSATEPVVLGQTLLRLMNQMITAIETLQYHPAVIPGTQLPLEQVRQQLNQILSKQNKTL